MMNYDALINPEELKLGDTVNTGGVFYAPYYVISCIAIGPSRFAIHAKGHQQYWGQSAHYIPAHIIVFERRGITEYGSWECKKIFDKECGRQSRAVKAEAIRLVGVDDALKEGD